MKMIYRAILLFISISILSACAIKPVTISPMHTYTLNDHYAHFKKGKAQSKSTLLISMPTANPGLQSSKMIYVKKPFELEAFAYHQWVASPSQMLLPILSDAIGSAHLFHGVVTTPFSGMTDYRLDTHILVFEQEFLKPFSQFRLVVDASLINEKTHRLIISKRFTKLVDAQANTPYAGVLAANIAANGIAKDVVRLLADIAAVTK